MASETSEMSEIDALARELYRRADSTGLWSCADYPIQAYFRKEAARKLQQKITADTQRSLPIISGEG